MSDQSSLKRLAIVLLSVMTVALHVARFTILPMESIKFYTWHLMLGLLFVFLYKPLPKKGIFPIIDGLCMLSAVAVGSYVLWTFDETIVLLQSSAISGPLFVLGILLMLLIFEATRRALGWALPSIALLMMAYAMFGGNLPGLLGHRGYSFERIISTIISDQGAYGTPIAVSANTIFLFLMFGAFLGVSGASGIFQELAIALAGKRRGGPAKMAVIASCLFGSISGSAVANVVSTGAFTIPLMKRQGYSARFSGAVEAVASTGGQIMPPIMGAAAFVLADISQTPYSTVALAALLPAVMYYITLFKQVDLRAVRREIGGGKDLEIPELSKVLARSLKLFGPLIVLLYLLLVQKATPQFSAIWATAVLIVLSFLDPKERMGPKRFLDGLVETCRSIPQVVAACACSGIVTGMFALTGVGLKFSDAIVALGQNALLPSLILSMFVCIILGMGLPTTASYIISATALAPALIKIGLPPLAAHLFVLYFACISAITPPVAVASYAAASIADENAFKVGLTGVTLGISGFILPYAFVLNNDYLHFGLDLLTLVTWISGIVVALATAVAIQGYVEDRITWMERLLYLVVIGLAIQHNFMFSFLGWALFALLYGGRKIRYRRSQREAENVAGA